MKMNGNTKLTTILGLLFLVGTACIAWAGGSDEAQTVAGPDAGVGDGPYRDYSEDEFLKAADARRVIFFHASWCPSCRAAETDIKADLGVIPDDVVVFKADYDQEKALKQRYGITYQHTFVYVDAEGKTIATWNGGGAAEIAANVRG